MAQIRSALFPVSISRFVTWNSGAKPDPLETLFSIQQSHMERQAEIACSSRKLFDESQDSSIYSAYR